jgi:hypothetical protein
MRAKQKPGALPLATWSPAARVVTKAALRCVDLGCLVGSLPVTTPWSMGTSDIGGVGFLCPSLQGVGRQFGGEWIATTTGHDAAAVGRAKVTTHMSDGMLLVLGFVFAEHHGGYHRGLALVAF